jgi:putative ATPase
LLYDPGDNVREKELRSFLSKRWKGKYGYWGSIDLQKTG